MLKVIRILNNLILPEYFIITVFSVFASSLIIVGGLNTSVLLPILSLSFVMIGFNSINNVFDVNIDKITKPDRPIPQGLIKPRVVILFSIISFIIAISFSFLIDIFSVFIIIILILLAILYSIPPLRLKKYLFSSNIIGSITYGLAPFILTWRAVGGEIPYFFLIFFTFLIFSTAPIKDIEDISGERKTEIKTIPIVIGKKRTMNFIIIALIILNTIALFFEILKCIKIEYIFATIISYIIIYFLKIVYNKNMKELRIKTQSKLVTLTMMAVILIELSYGFISFF